MNETERILKDGILPETFFEEEVICDFKVDFERKKLWAVSLDLLFKFDEVCRKHHLKYTLAYGSLLGAIRHHGIIPWDDDVDVFMLREDYEVLKTLKDEFQPPYFLQIPGENGYLYSYAKVRNSNTTALSYAFRYSNFNQGIPLDIFILDNYNQETFEQDSKKVERLIRECSTLMRRTNPHPEERDMQFLSQFPVIRPGKEVINELERTIIKEKDSVDSDRCITLSNIMYDLQRGIFPRSCFTNLTEISLYGHSVFIPEDYDLVLRIIYGDYMTLPPVEERGKWHSTSVFDTEKPYTEYIKALWDKEKK
jgi:lipopolysaccharide cholinephosphotransferase